MSSRPMGGTGEFEAKNPHMKEFAHNTLQNQITQDDVVSKLKDDGDFDRLRLKIIRKLKDDEELRENLKSIVSQSAAINRSGAENMKPRQLSDAIYQEVGDQLIGRISDGLWGIIRSSDGMSSEIVDTVQSVYKRLVSAEEFGHNGSGLSRANEADGSEPKAPPGFSLPLSKSKVVDSPVSFCREKRPIDEQQQGCSGTSQDKRELDGVDTENKQSDECRDEDPDVPPGFG